MDFYERKTQALNKVNELLDSKASYQDILLEVNLKFGFGEKLVLAHLKNLYNTGALTRENTKLSLKEGFWRLEYE